MGAIIYLAGARYSWFPPNGPYTWQIVSSWDRTYYSNTRGPLHLIWELYKYIIIKAFVSIPHADPQQMNKNIINVTC